MKLLQIITVLSGAAASIACTTDSFTSALSANNTTQHLRHRRLEPPPWAHDKIPDPDISFRGNSGNIQRGVRCATKGRPVTNEELQEKLKQVRKERDHRALSAGIVSVIFHVIHDGLAGKIPDGTIKKQIAVLNAAYQGTGYSFELKDIQFHDSKKYFRRCYNQDSMMKSEYAVDPTHNLNLYTCRPSGGILGWAYFPNAAPEGHTIHGVVCLDGSLPDGWASPYNLGDTAVHEVGHYLGLYHTFQGGCTGNGDFVADTPPEASPAYYCTPRDTCEDGVADPIKNFMDYTDDACMDSFTNGQMERMRDMMEAYRPSLFAQGEPPTADCTSDCATCFVNCNTCSTTACESCNSGYTMSNGDCILEVVGGCEICSGTNEECCAPRACKGQTGNQKCRG
jgi:hypothetical protein